MSRASLVAASVAALAVIAAWRYLPAKVVGEVTDGEVTVGEVIIDESLEAIPDPLDCRACACSYADGRTCECSAQSCDGQPAA